MTVLIPTNLETVKYGQQGWNGVLSDNMTILNALLVSLWGPTQATYALGARPVVAPAAVTQPSTLTDTTLGTYGTNVGSVSATFVASELNNIHRTILEEINKVHHDNYAIRGCITDLLYALRVTTGNGVLSD